MSRDLVEYNKILSELDLSNFLRRSSEWIKKNNAKWVSEKWHSFHSHLLKESISFSEKLLLAKSAFGCVNEIMDEPDLAQLLIVGLKIKSMFGTDLFLRLFSRKGEDKRTIRDYLTICQLLMDLQGEKNLVKIVKENNKDLSKLKDTLTEMHTVYMEEKYPEKDIEEVLNRFSGEDDQVEFPLSKDELRLIKMNFEKIKEECIKLKTLTQNELQILAKKSPNRELLVAILAETVRRVFKISLHHTQLISILALISEPEKLKGHIAQIKTGEGKSVIIAMLAAYFSCKGEKLDVVTSSSYLAKFAVENNKAFFKALGLTTSHICYDQPESKDFDADIVYGTNTDFEFTFLRDGTDHTKIRNRPYDTVIVDEADNFFIDLANSSAIIAAPGSEDIGWIHPVIWKFIQGNELRKADMGEWSALLRQHLLKTCDEKYRNLIQSFSDIRLKHWLISARKALHHMHPNVHYLVKTDYSNAAKGPQDEIIPIDKDNTGRLTEGVQWQHGLHQFLQVKHGLTVEPEHLPCASISHPNFFNLYKRILGLTGTMGENAERSEIHDVYHVDSFDAPPNVPSKRIRFPGKLSPDETSQYEAIYERIKEMQGVGRPCLILFESIESSNKFWEYLKSKGVTAQLLNETQRESEDYIIGCAGESGRITIATNTAGRGTDIKLTKESKKAGGLHMMFTFFPKNKRVQDQGVGRAGRQGDDGSCEMILTKQDLEIYKLFLGLHLGQINYTQPTPEVQNALMLKLILEFSATPDKELFKIIEEARSIQVEKESKQRYLVTQREGLFFEKLVDFFKLTQSVNDTFDRPDFKESFIKLCESFKPERLESYVFSEDPSWLDVQKLAFSLLEKQAQGLVMDWGHFFERFKRAYLKNLQQIWAKFYSKCQSEIEGDDIDEIKLKLDAEHNKVMSQLNCFLLKPEANILALLMSLLKGESLANDKHDYKGLEMSALYSGVNLFKPGDMKNDLGGGPQTHATV